MLVLDARTPTIRYYVLHFGRLVNIDATTADTYEGGPSITVSDSTIWDRIVSAWPADAPDVELEGLVMTPGTPTKYTIAGTIEAVDPD